MRGAGSRPPCARPWLRAIWRSGAAGAVVAAVLALVIAECGTRVAPGARSGPHGPVRAALTTTFPLPGILGVASGGGATWVTTGNAVLRIDARTDRASQVLSDPGASLTGIALGAGSVWVEDDAGILRVDPVTGKITARIGVHAAVVCFGEGALWALGYLGGGTLVRIDPATDDVRTFPLPAGKIEDLAAGEGAVWVSAVVPPWAGLLRVDPASGRVVARISGTHLFGQVAVGDGAVWASDGAAVARIDPRTDAVTATAPLLSPLPASGPSPVLYGSGRLAVAPAVVWVTAAGNARQARVLRIDPRTGRLTGAGLGVGGQPQAVAASGTTLWVVTARGLARIDLVGCGAGRCARPAPPGWLPAAPAPVWLDSLQMTSATSGWALAWSANPAVAADNAHILLARTADGARTWRDVTPAAARPMLATLNSYEALDPVDGDRAYLAVSRAASDDDLASATAVFATADGGRTWTESAVFRTSAPAARVSFADASHGWLLLGPVFSAPGQPVTWLYRTSDGGLRWSPAATAAPPGDYGSNSFCQPLNLTMLTAATGWVVIGCRGQPEFLVSHDGGGSWAAQPLPLPAGTTLGSPGGPAFLTGPQFAGGTGFLTVAPPPPGTASLLGTRDRGRTWQVLALPPGAGQYPQVTFFTPADGVLVTAGLQQALGAVFYLTADGGHSWTPVPQGTHFTQYGEAIDFASQQAGFAWNPNTSGAPPIYATTNSGRTWTWYLPQLAGGPQ
jgi:hypothetical protein